MILITALCGFFVIIWVNFKEKLCIVLKSKIDESTRPLLQPRLGQIKISMGVPVPEKGAVIHARRLFGRALQSLTAEKLPVLANQSSRLYRESLVGR